MQFLNHKEKSTVLENASILGNIIVEATLADVLGFLLL